MRKADLLGAALIQPQKEGNSEFANPCSDCGSSSPVSLSGQGLVFLVMNEEWRPIAGYEGLYEVSNFGKVRSFPRGGTIHEIRVLKQAIANMGYYVVSLCKNGKPIKILVHRLVAKAFLPPSEHPEVNHISGIKLDNRSNNLEWVSYREQKSHAYRIGLQRNWGDSNCRSTLTAEQVRYARTNYIPRKRSYAKLAKELGVKAATLGFAVRRDTYTNIK